MKNLSPTSKKKLKEKLEEELYLKQLQKEYRELKKQKEKLQREQRLQRELFLKKSGGFR